MDGSFRTQKYFILNTTSYKMHALLTLANLNCVASLIGSKTKQHILDRSITKKRNCTSSCELHFFRWTTRTQSRERQPVVKCEVRGGGVSKRLSCWELFKWKSLFQGHPQRQRRLDQVNAVHTQYDRHSHTIQTGLKGSVRRSSANLWLVLSL